MIKIIEDLFKIDRYLLGGGFDKSLEYINEIIPLEVNGVKSGTKVGNWEVPEEWVIRDGWVKFNGEKIIDWKENPLSVVVGSLPINKKVTLQEFKDHLFVSDERPDAYSYDYKFYERDWGFTIPKTKIQNHMIYDKEGKIVCENGICIPEFKDIDPTVGKVVIDGVDTAPKWEDKMVEGEYEVFIDSEYKPGIMKWGVHTIKGVSDREILLFAHLDHPWMANDNLSGVACLIDMAKELKEKGFKHTIKLVFCAETIGSIAYAETEDISKVDFVIAVDSVGNDNSLLIQKSFDKYSRLNYCMHLACSSHAVDYRKGDFRFVVGSDEYYFNDPKIGIPGIMLSRIPYPEYHTADDIPEIIKEEKIKQTQNTILEIIDIYERDYIPVRHFTGPLMRSKYGIQTGHKSLNMGLDYLFYDIDGEKYLSELVLPLGLSFNFAYEALEKVDVISKKDENKLSNPRKKSVKKTGK